MKGFAIPDCLDDARCGSCVMSTEFLILPKSTWMETQGFHHIQNFRPRKTYSRNTEYHTSRTWGGPYSTICDYSRVFQNLRNSVLEFLFTLPRLSPISMLRCPLIRNAPHLEASRSRSMVWSIL